MNSTKPLYVQGVIALHRCRHIVLADETCHDEVLSTHRHGLRAIQFLIFPSLPRVFNPFPPGGGRGAVKLAPLRRRSRGERLGWGGSAAWACHRSSPPPAPSPISGGGKRRTGAELENCMTLGDHNRCRQMVAVFEDETRLLAVFRRFQIFSAARSGTISSLVQKSQ